ncbi:MAG: TolC family protein, partial [Nitratireductor sp.]
MRIITAKVITLAALPLLAAGCATTAAVDTDPLNAFAPVSDRTASVTGKQTVWVQSAEEARKVGDRVQALVRNRTVGPDTAVQVALLNNKGLQAAYADVGLSQAEVWQQSLLVNPTVSVGLTGVDPVRSIEATVANNILAVITRPKRMAIADTRLRQAQLRAAEE